MRRNYISPEFIKEQKYGSFNSTEDSSFFASKMLDIEDQLLLGDVDIIYNQSFNGEQLSSSGEDLLNQIVWDILESKRTNHTLEKYRFSNTLNTKWILTIEVKSLLSEWLFAKLKESKTFLDLREYMVVGKDVNKYIRDYININVIDRYKIKEISLFINPNTSNENKFTKLNNTYKVTKLNIEKSSDESQVKVNYNQDGNFYYYYNITFEKL